MFKAVQTSLHYSTGNGVEYIYRLEPGRCVWCLERLDDHTAFPIRQLKEDLDAFASERHSR